MSLPNKPSKKYNDLLSKSYWSVQDLFWILMGDFGFNNVLPIVQGEHQKYNDIAEKIEIAANQGRFGYLLNTETIANDPIGAPFSWGVFHQSSDPDHNETMDYEKGLELLSFLPTFCIHPMRIIDWIESEEIFSLIECFPSEH